MQSIGSVGASKFGGTSSDDADLLGAFTLYEFCDRFRISRGFAYQEKKAGRLRFSYAGSKVLITRGEARRYQAMLEAGTAA